MSSMHGGVLTCASGMAVAEERTGWSLSRSSASRQKEQRFGGAAGCCSSRKAAARPDENRPMAHRRVDHQHALRGIAHLRMLASERSPSRVGSWRAAHTFPASIAGRLLTGPGQLSRWRASRFVTASSLLSTRVACRAKNHSLPSPSGTVAPVAPPPHNSVKLPLYWCCLVGCIVVAGLAALNDSWLLAGVGLALILFLLAALRVVRQDRNPWWTRAPLDRREARRRRA